MSFTEHTPESLAALGRVTRADLERWEAEWEADPKWEGLVSLAVFAVWTVALAFPVMVILYLLALVAAIRPW